METKSRTVRPSPSPRTVLDEQGNEIAVPAGWVLLPPGDAALTRRVKKAGPTWTMQEKKGRKTFSKGVWAQATTIEAIRKDLENERSAPSYARKRDADKRRRQAQQSNYAKEFEAAVFQFLDFDQRYEGFARQLSIRIAAHAVPVGSGTVARTKRIPVDERAKLAVLAWLRHHTTAYDDMKIRRVKGERRRVRRELASQSLQLLKQYRDGDDVDELDCPLHKALKAS